MVIGLDVFLDLGAKVPGDEDNLVDRQLGELVQNVTENWLAGDVDQRLGLGIGMRAQPRSETGDRNNYFHAYCLAFQSPLCSNAYASRNSLSSLPGAPKS